MKHLVTGFHFTQEDRRKTISFYQTFFTIILLLPVFLTMTTLLDEPKTAVITRFLLVTSVSYLILFATALGSIHLY